MGKRSSRKGVKIDDTAINYNERLQHVILKLTRLESLFRQLEPLFCNELHFEEAMVKISDLKLIYEELKEYSLIVKSDV